MTDEIEMPDLDAPPGTDRITELRETARKEDETVGVRFPASDGVQKGFVVSPRGTCVLLNDTREDTFNRSVDAEDIAASLRE